MMARAPASWTEGLRHLARNGADTAFERRFSLGQSPSLRAMILREGFRSNVQMFDVEIVDVVNYLAKGKGRCQKSGLTRMALR